MNPESERLVRESWEILRPKSAVLAESFYARLFESSPAAASLFASTDMEAQRRKFIVMLHEIVRVLDHPRLLVSEVMDSGRRHVSYGARDEHYPAVGSALLWSIAQALGTDSTTEVLTAWREAFDLLATVMKQGASGEGTAAV